MNVESLSSYSVFYNYNFFLQYFIVFVIKKFYLLVYYSKGIFFLVAWD
jgi:hypothetical protein